MVINSRCQVLWVGRVPLDALDIQDDKALTVQKRMCMKKRMRVSWLAVIVDLPDLLAYDNDIEDGEGQ
jgi:hypothetical protein